MATMRAAGGARIEPSAAVRAYRESAWRGEAAAHGDFVREGVADLPRRVGEQRTVFDRRINDLINRSVHFCV